MNPALFSNNRISLSISHNKESSTVIRGRRVARGAAGGGGQANDDPLPPLRRPAWQVTGKTLHNACQQLLYACKSGTAISVSIPAHLELVCLYSFATLHVSSLPIMVCMDHVLGGGLGAPPTSSARAR